MLEFTGRGAGNFRSFNECFLAWNFRYVSGMKEVQPKSRQTRVYLYAYFWTPTVNRE
jgi:hypothetical protein